MTPDNMQTTLVTIVTKPGECKQAYKALCGLVGALDAFYKVKVEKVYEVDDIGTLAAKITSNDFKNVRDYVDVIIKELPGIAKTEIVAPCEVVKR